ncbi:WD40-repeat-containing domain protein [Radiomyces spectabilis]|uniref:WD40-repeat-containing domain protein n=1 Tax=Radiomyces spectabilis TaxID=64574 RepID=UPI00221F03C0|nr:WD40-repeat-containing domain protein [Radiomyces spectabilis]KAI8374673.1 WD40-repeat-containing domain protein [Radiomyces spectabilis]
MMVVPNRESWSHLNFKDRVASRSRSHKKKKNRSTAAAFPFRSSPDRLLFVFMDTQDLPQRFAHTEGFTTVAYTFDGSELITAGNDSLVRIFKTSHAERNSDALVLDKHSEAVLCIAVNKDSFVTAGADGIVALFHSNSKEFQKYLVRSTSPVRSISYNHNGSKMAIATDEDVIRVVLIHDISRVVNMRGHTRFVKSVAFDPSGDYLVSSGCEGDVRVWDANPIDGEPTCLQVLKNVTRATLSDSNLLSTVAWRPDGAYFAVPGKNNDICVYRRTLWTLAYTLEKAHVDDVITVAWSPNGRYLASTAMDNQVIIWDTSKKSVVKKFTSSIQVSGISWHPTENELAFTDLYGQLTVWDRVIDISDNHPHPAHRRPRITETQLDKLFEEDEDDIAMDNGRAGEREADGDVDMSLLDTLDDFVSDDDGAGYAETTDHAQPRPRPAGRLLHEPSYAIQKPRSFQPNATPYPNMDASDATRPREGERRYLAFNLIGVIYTIFQGSHSIVNVEFHDQSQNRNFHFTDYHHYSLAAVGEKGAVFAVEGHEKPTSERRNRNEDGDEDDDEEEEEEEEEEAQGVSSALYFRPLNHWANNAEWTVHMPLGEDIQNVAINRVSVIVVTTAGLVRIFSLSGVQIHLFRLADVVTVTAAADLAMFVYATGPCFKGHQYLKFMLMNTDSLDILQKDSLPIPENTEITWAGFSETTQPAFFDSKGVLSVLHRQRRPGQAAWIPIFDGPAAAAAKDRKERYWPIGLLRDRFMCLVLRAQHEYPSFPRPAVSEVELRMPTVSFESEVGQLEERYLRTNIMSLHERDEAAATNTEDEFYVEFNKADVEMDKALLQLIQLACKADKTQRALDLVATLHMTRSIDAAIKIASFHRLTSLAEKITRVKEDKFMGGGETVRRGTSLAESQEPYQRIFTSSQLSMSSDLAFVDRTPEPGRANRKRDMVEPEDEEMTQSSDMLLSPLPKRTRPEYSSASSF